MNKRLSRYLRILLFMLADATIVTLSAGITAYIVGFDTSTRYKLVWLLTNICLTVCLLSTFGLYTFVAKTAGVYEGIKTIICAVGMFILNLIFYWVTKGQFISDKFCIVFAILLGFFLLMLRFAKRIFLLGNLYAGKKDIRVMIIGAGDAGVAVIRELQNSEKVNYKPVCVIDDDETKLHSRICNVKVVGTTDEIPQFVEKYDVKEIFITMPSIDNKRKSEIVHKCKDTGCVVKTLPGIYQFANGQVSTSNLKKVEISDLLGREAVKVNLDQIIGYIENKVVLVTGGGGSIGSELCRQIARHNPRQLIILDIYENNAYDIEQELKRELPYLNLLVLIASVRDKGKMRDVFTKYRPQIVFHAAAHKHVPLMETSPNEAVKNNVFGTYNTAKLADEFKVETFVLISTDKAINPTNIMGATKRICEMIVQTIGKNSKNTNFVAVRFGNVLGSNGSVIPLFRKQIENGGPLTVTHKDIIRYFMTIPEAVSLVLQAGAYAKNGQIFVLDMGEPVRIYDLAENLIKLSGLKPNEDIEIKITGLRPGEKLYEERLMKEEGLQKTDNGLISIAKPIPLDEDLLWTTLEKLYVEAYNETEKMKDYVKELVPTYTIDRRGGGYS